MAGRSPFDSAPLTAGAMSGRPDRLATVPHQSAPAAAETTAGHSREILRLAVPAFGALIAEPLFLLADSAIVGHLGVAQLAGVGLASAVLHTAVGLMVFLAYSTTPAVARAIGDGQLGKALAAGRDGVWLALLLGVVLAAAGFCGGRSAGGTHGRGRRCPRLRRRLPPLVHAGTCGHVAHFRRNRRPPRAPGHPHAAGGGHGRLRPEYRPEPLAGLRPWLVGHRLCCWHQHRAMGHGRRLPRDGPAQCLPARRQPAARLAGHPCHDAGRIVADAAHAQPAHRHSGHGAGGDGPGCRSTWRRTSWP